MLPGDVSFTTSVAGAGYTREAVLGRGGPVGVIEYGSQSLCVGAPAL